MSKAQDVSKNDFVKEVLESELPVLVDFWAPWCMPCKMMAPILDELSADMNGKVKIVKVNTEDSANQELAAEYQIQSIPNMKLFKGGKVVADFIGMRSKDTLKKDIEAHLS
ncbi:thioredoxin [Candidatus Falkowbacteria bacterium HGW-Falkowbacteria-1]|jgi:thioredoxin 1|uniref:Thioredoxin n=1 Tax=Candidatus Falkowbacteria bacterium HGW-Falkowbacteria-1 TaxID=2013768 RepID=A0A2N2EAB1_9BACT|nr:MAG: thioredoxin [Candidatus Falkowbacteria bacterium HGW-Falkowbacteria-1]